MRINNEVQQLYKESGILNEIKWQEYGKQNTYKGKREEKCPKKYSRADQVEESQKVHQSRNKWTASRKLSEEGWRRVIEDRRELRPVVR